MRDLLLLYNHFVTESSHQESITFVWKWFNKIYDKWNYVVFYTEILCLFGKCLETCQATQMFLICQSLCTIIECFILNFNVTIPMSSTFFANEPQFIQMNLQWNIHDRVFTGLKVAPIDYFPTAHETFKFITLLLYLHASRFWLHFDHLTTTTTTKEKKISHKSFD